jgi:PAS domain S-box-containing protein
MDSDQRAGPAISSVGQSRADPSRGQLGDVLERVSDAVVALDSNWRYTYVNLKAAELFGRRREELLGRQIWAEFPEGVGQPFQLAYEQAMRDQVPMQIEQYYEPWDRWFENRIYPSPDGLSIFFHEISDRRRAEREARDNAALLKGQNRVLESIARGAPLEHSLDMLLRFIEAECPEMICSIVLPEDGGDSVRHGAAPSLPSSFTSALEGGSLGACASAFVRTAFTSDAVIVADITSDPLWTDCREIALEHDLRAAWSSPILDARGGVLGTFAVYARTPGRPSPRHRYLIDVATQTAATALVNHRQAEARRASDERLRLAVTGGNVGIWEWDVVHDRFSLSDQLRAMFDWPIQTGPLTLSDITAAIHRDDRPRVEEALERSVTLGVDYDVEYRVVGPGGAVRWVATKGAGEYRDSSTPVRMMGVALDITTRKETEIQLRQSEERLEQTVSIRTAQLRNRNEELKAFAYTVSHDLKAPLRGIAGYARELERRHSAGLEERGRHCLQQILAATHNLDRLIEDLLHYSRLDAETPSPIEVDLAHLVLAMIRDRRPVILEHGTDVTVDLDVVRVRAWERGLTQVLSNLFDNALKYSRRAPQPQVRIATEPLANSVRLTVADNGIGFDPKYQDRIFGLFNRLVRPEDFEGTGAGLASARKVVEKMGGTIRAEGVPGAGATFIVELPADAAITPRTGDQE